MSSDRPFTAGTYPHQTRTFQLNHDTTWHYKPSGRGPFITPTSRVAKAECTCGWSAYVDTREIARTRARVHRDRAADMLTFLPGRASLPGRRRVNADASAVHVDHERGASAWALADGIGDTDEAAEFAAAAADVASREATQQGATGGLLAASQHLQGHCGNATLVVATAVPAENGGGYDIAWVGDCRAYHWTGAELLQLTIDHTLQQRVRESSADADHAVAAQHATTVATASPESVGAIRTHGPHQRLVLTSDGLHQYVAPHTLSRAARQFRHPQNLADRLMSAAAFHIGRDNATALVIDPATPRH